MTTSVTPEQFLASLDKWGVKWRFYSNKADWLTHNRNGAGNNVRATPGGFGPLRGAAAHNTASTSQTGMLVYLYNGDSARSLPGPLCNWAVLKTGEVVLMGWGTSNATGPGDPVPDSLVRKNAMPVDREITPTTAGPSDPNAILYAPYYLGWEACHASEGPTVAQYRSVILAACAALDAMGGPAAGYGGGSVVMHRELTMTRSDPQGVGKAQIRRDIDAQFKAGPPKATGGTVTPAPAPLKTVSTALTSDRPNGLTKGETVTLSGTVTPAVAGTMVFDWLDDTGTWQRFAKVPVDAKGKASVTNRPSKNVTYRIGFDPTSAAYANGNYSAHMSVAVVDLVRLMTEHRAVLDELAAANARLDALEKAATPTPTALPGDATP